MSTLWFGSDCHHHWCPGDCVLPVGDCQCVLPVVVSFEYDLDSLVEQVVWVSIWRVAVIK